MVRSRRRQDERPVERSDLDPLVLDFLEWLTRARRPYAEVMDAWRTSCPRLTVWEDAIDRGLVARAKGEVIATEAGLAFLAQDRQR